MPPIDDQTTILVVGLGTMGSQIALQAARFGLQVVVNDVDPAAEERFRISREKILAEWVEKKLIDAAAAAALPARLRFETDPARAARDIQLLVEATPEVVETKLKVFRHFEPLCPPEAIFVTTTSYLTASMLLEAVNRAPRFAAYHFHEPVWYANVVDVMPHPGTSPETVDWLVALARRLDQIPIVCRRERPGYVGNAMLDAVLGAAILRVADGVAPVEDVDRAWMGVMKTPIGPFGILDRIGLDVAYDIMRCWQEVSADPFIAVKMSFLKHQIDAGRLGVKTGHGFYEYPHPDFARPDFLKKTREDAGQQLAANPQGARSIPPPITKMTLRRYALAIAGPIDFVINFTINAAIAWLVFRNADRVPLCGVPSAFILTAPMSFFVPLFATYFGHANGIAARRRGLNAGAPPVGPEWRSIAWRRGLVLAVIGVGITISAFTLWGAIQPNGTLAVTTVIWGDGLVAGTLGYAAQACGVLRTRRPVVPSAKD